MNTLACQSPEALLESFFLRQEKTGAAPAIVVVTGGRGAGKTYWCQQLLGLLSRDKFSWQSLSVSGLISPALMWGTAKVGIQLLDVSSGESRILACRHAAPEGRNPHAAGYDRAFATAAWKFSPAAIAWGNQILARIKSCDVLLLDELGPLEFEREAGLQSGMALLDRRTCRLALVVVRPELVPAALQRWPEARVMEVHRPEG